MSAGCHLSARQQTMACRLQHRPILPESFKISSLKMSVVSLQEYRDLIVRSGLLTADSIEEELNSYSSDPAKSSSDDVDDVTGFAKHMESAGLLTQWQNANLLRGRYRGLMFGKFRILRLLGAGGMGRVFLAENQMLQRQVALKILPKKLSKQTTALQRFHREARALARLSHDNIVRVHDVDVHDGTHYIVMEYVHGVDLHRMVRKQGPLDEATAANYICQAANGLAHAHEADLIHRDVKPANMLINAKGEIKVLDLGLALLQTEEDGSLTADPTKALGTADYISPEQALNSRDIDARTDIYSLGCSLYYLLTGAAPFGKGTNAERLLAHQLRDPTPINELRAELKLAPVSETLASICVRMMAKAPADRYATAADVAAALSPIGGVTAAATGSPLDADSSDMIDSQSSLDTASLQQLKTISESASSISNHAGGRAKKSPATSRSKKSNRSRTAIFSLGAGAAVCALAMIGWMRSGSASSENSDGVATSPIAVAKPAVGINDELLPFFVVGTNQTYHTRDCRHVHGKSNVRQITQQAKSAGIYRPCRVCKPDQ